MEIKRIISDSDQYDRSIYWGYYETGKQMCSICNNFIPKDIKRLSYEYKNKVYTTLTHFRVCESCIERLSKDINIKRIENWRNEIIIKKL